MLEEETEEEVRDLKRKAEQKVQQVFLSLLYDEPIYVCVPIYFFFLPLKILKN